MYHLGWTRFRTWTYKGSRILGNYKGQCGVLQNRRMTLCRAHCHEIGRASCRERVWCLV